MGTGLIGLAWWIALRNLGLPTQDGWMFAALFRSA